MSKKYPTAFSTTVFPSCESYLDDFFISLSDQTNTNFDLIILNDGLKSLKEYKLKYSTLNIIVLNSSETPAKNREVSINYIKSKGYDSVIFGDCDDYFSKNRVNHTLELLKNNDIVINDITLFNQNGIFTSNYISNRLNNNTSITLNFIRNKNIFGLSNTAFNLQILSSITFDKNLIAVDWYLFSFLLYNNKHAIFTSKTTTFYRQHEVNTVGFGKLTIEKVKKLLPIKLKHYQLMSKFTSTYDELLNETEVKIQLIKNEHYLNELVEKTNNTLNFPLWWECK